MKACSSASLLNSAPTTLLFFPAQPSATNQKSEAAQNKIESDLYLKEGVDVKGPVVASCDGQALEGGPGRVSQQGQKLLPCPGLLQHSCKEVWRPAVSQTC